MTLFPLACLFLLFAYALGSISSAVLMSRVFQLPDPRAQGSRNPGATNVLRLSGKPFAVGVLLFDVMKGFLPVMLAGMSGLSPTVQSIVGLCAVLGHMYPIFFGFKGGKGVATALGLLYALSWGLGAATLLLGLSVIALTRYVSLGSVVAIGMSPFFALLFYSRSVGVFGCLACVALWVIVRHKDNLRRLRAGTEPKLGR